MSQATPRPTSALLAPFTLLRREVEEISQNRTAVLGGAAGTGAIMSAAVALALLGPSVSRADPIDADDDTLDMEFLPGELVRRGDTPPEDEKLLVDATQAAADSPDAAVTRDDQAAPTPAPSDAPKQPKTPSTERPDPDKRDAEISDENRDTNNTYDDPATVKELPGDPFGSAKGWSDRLTDGDPWAIAVLAALNDMSVGSYAGLGQEGTYKFQLVLCADGSIEAVRTKQSTGRPDFDGRIRHALTTLKLPKAPPAIAEQLADKCKKMPYEFTWSGSGASGTIR